MQLQGKIHLIADTQQVSDRFKKREIVLEYSENPMYPQYVLFQFIQDNVAKLDSFNRGDLVNITFSIKGRAWTSPQGETKYFNSLDAYDISIVSPSTDAPPPTATPAQEVVGQDGDNDDDLPF